MNNVNNCLLVASNWAFHLSVRLFIAERVYMHRECAAGEVLIGKFCVMSITCLFFLISGGEVDVKQSKGKKRRRMATRGKKGIIMINK